MKKKDPETLYTVDDLTSAARYAAGNVYQLVMETLAAGMEHTAKTARGMILPGDDPNKIVIAKAAYSALQSIVISLGQVDPRTFDWGPEVARLIDLTKAAVAEMQTGENAVP